VSLLLCFVSAVVFFSCSLVCALWWPRRLSAAVVSPRSGLGFFASRRLSAAVVSPRSGLGVFASRRRSSSRLLIFSSRQQESFHALHSWHACVVGCSADTMSLSAVCVGGTGTDRESTSRELHVDSRCLMPTPAAGLQCCLQPLHTARWHWLHPCTLRAVTLVGSLHAATGPTLPTR